MHVASDAEDHGPSATPAAPDWPAKTAAAADAVEEQDSQRGPPVGVGQRIKSALDGAQPRQPERPRLGGFRDQDTELEFGEAGDADGQIHLQVAVAQSKSDKIECTTFSRTGH
ncbi:hypothetical protein [Micromonospora phaseoli]|uniref:hypothetical protein n=1 Tax=Micromonospora phaseoli TaxID=1144548 RepID=UPI0015878424|nr:hypothetical protein [Micromonospora phaseoli]GIJ81474.1 hypothetical protein Xph01_59060 [Micromonospora phaseoli]